MPAKNQSQHTVSGSGSTSSPPEKPPDLLFSNIPKREIHSRRHVVYVEWNMAVHGFSLVDLDIMWDHPGQPSPLPPGAYPPDGRGVTMHRVDDRTYAINIVFPGKVDAPETGTIYVEVTPHCAQAQGKASTGPPGKRAFAAHYNRAYFDGTVGKTHRGANLTLSVPFIAGTGTWRQSTYTQRFTWDKPVTNFTRADIDIGTGAGPGTITTGELAQHADNNHVYELPITFTGSGTYQISVDAFVANAGGSPTANSPPQPIEKSWAFDVNETERKLPLPDGATELAYDVINIGDEHPERINPAHSGSYLGVSDMTVFEGRLYFVSQIQRPARGELSTALPSAGALVSLSTTEKVVTPTVHKKYRVFTAAARSLTPHDKHLYFFQGSSYLFPKSHHAVEVDEIGMLYQMQSGDGAMPELIGLNWRSDFATGPKDAWYGVHAGTLSPMRFHKEQLHLISMRQELLEQNGILWIVWGNKENRKLPLLETNGRKTWDVLEELALLANAYVGVENGTFIFKSRTPPHTQLTAAIDDETQIIRTGELFRAKDWQRTSGHLIVGNEVIHYQRLNIDEENKTSSFIGATRGAGGTLPAQHDKDSKVIQIVSLIDTTDLKRPVNEMDIETNATQLYNSVEAEYAEGQAPRTEHLRIYADDEQSQIENGKRETTIKLPLDFYQPRWANAIAHAHLQKMKQLHFIVNLTLTARLELEIGDIVFLTEPILSKTQFAAEIIEVTQLPAREETEIKVIRLGEAAS